MQAAAAVGAVVGGLALGVLEALAIRYTSASIAPMLPLLVIIADFFAIFGGAVFALGPVEISLMGYFSQTLAALETWDVLQGLVKGWVFGVLVVLIGVSTGFNVQGGAEGVGRATTRAVVVSICAILIADMAFSFFLNR